MYQQLSNGRNVFLSFTALGRAFDRIIRGRANLVWEGALLCTVGLIYGGVHLATWNNYFVSAFERHAWRACSIVTAVAVLGFVLELCIGALIRFIDPETSIKPFTSESKTQRQPQPSTGREKVAGNGTQQSAREPVEKNAEIIEATTPHEHEHDSATTPAAKSEAARNDPRKRDTWSWRAYRLVVAVTVFFGFIVVMFTRCFLLVESFIALRKQPDGVYDTINWVQTVPHVAK
ncbi:hypothetical protein BZA05DRAFT_406211 [Tricharina praecox]|uniref:uncharacterized protein n=1 Tax=Tricharina praecox TaxID=43433 RepID=UPI00221FBA22|nr:uncharacterized protein BZA05DRAFT_406211 [Tricharina praecox]KAI5846659.1 hypothetical protein BZA05DRAFT_406211 [Tricharina praecox]